MWSTGTMYAMVGEAPPFPDVLRWVFADHRCATVPVDRALRIFHLVLVYFPSSSAKGPASYSFRKASSMAALWTAIARPTFSV